MSTVAAHPGVFAYDPGEFWDEMFAGPGEVRPYYAPLGRALSTLSTADVERRQRAADLSFQARGITFDKAVELFLVGNEVGWKNQKHRLEWRTSLRVYASPIIGTLPVGSIDTSHVTKVLDPIWHEKTETASRIRGRIERVLDWARVRGYRAAGENPARWRGHLEETYPARGKVRPVEHHAAVTIDAMPTLYGRLTEADDVASRALRFIILTVARAGEAVGRESRRTRPTGTGRTAPLCAAGQSVPWTGWAGLAGQRDPVCRSGTGRGRHRSRRVAGIPAPST